MASAIIDKPKLTVLSCTHSNIGDEGVGIFLGTFLVAYIKRETCRSYCDFYQILQRARKECPSKSLQSYLLRLLLFNHLPGTVTLSDSLSGKTRLENLYFGFNGVGDRGALTLVRAVTSSPQLSLLELDGNPAITFEGAAQIRKLMRAASLDDDWCTIACAPCIENVCAGVKFEGNDCIDCYEECVAHKHPLHRNDPSCDGYESNICPSICPGGVLRQPSALYIPNGQTCLERETSCVSNPGSCGACAKMQFEAIVSTDCCGSRTLCTPDQLCSGRDVDRGVEFYLEGIGTITCGALADNFAATLLPCEEASLFADQFWGCCV